MPSRANVSFLFLSFLCVVGCGGNGGSTPAPGPTITNISVSCTPGSIQTDQTSQCSAAVVGTGGYSSAVTWATTGGSIGGTGLFTPASAGVATITATSVEDNSKTGSAQVAVSAAVTITSVSPTCSPASILTTQTALCSATVQGTGAFSPAVTWSATDGTITSAGVFNPAGVGTATITATSAQDGKESGSTSITIAAAPTVTSVAVSCFPTSIFSNQASSCQSNVNGAGAFDNTVVWSLSPPGIGILSNTGAFTPKAAGTATITATSAQDATKSGSASVVVTSSAAFIHGALIASPSLYPSATLTTMTLSIWLPDSTLDSSSVTAYETDALGSSMSSKGLLNDSGLNGDLVNGDSIYTIQFVVNDLSPTTHHYAISYKSLATGLTYWSELESAISVPTIPVTDATSYAQNIQNSMNLLADGTASYRALQPTQNTKLDQSSLDSFASTMISVLGNIQQLSSYDSINPLAVHAVSTGKSYHFRPTDSSSTFFWSLISPAFGAIAPKYNELAAEKSAFLGPSFNPNDPAVAGVMAWLAQNPDEELTCSPDLQTDVTGCRALIWTDYSESPSAGLLVAAASSAANAGISEYTGLAEDGAGDLLTSQTDLAPLAQWSISQEASMVTDYFVDNYISPSGRQLLIFGNTASGQTTALPNGSHQIIVAGDSGRTGTSDSSFPAIVSLSPSTVPVGSSLANLTITGSAFQPSSAVFFNGAAHAVSYVNGNTLVIALTPSDTAVAGNYPVLVTNSSANGVVSATATFWVTTGATVGSIAVGATPEAIAVNPVTNTIYVANTGSSSVTAINGADNSTTTIAVGVSPDALAVNALTNTIYVANAGSNTLTVIDGFTNKVSSVNVGISPEAVAIDPVTNMIYVTNYTSGDTTVIDGRDNNTTTISNTGGPAADPPQEAINSVTDKIYVTYAAPGGDVGNVTIIDGDTNHTANVTPGQNPTGIAINPLTNKIYVTNFWSNTLTIIDGDTNSTSTLSVGACPVSVAVNTITDTIFVSNEGCSAYAPGGVSVIDGSNNNGVEISLGSSPSAIAVNATTNTLYTADYAGDTLTMIDGTTLTATTLSIGMAPLAIAINPVTNKVYVANSGDNTVSVVGP